MMLGANTKEIKHGEYITKYVHVFFCAFLNCNFLQGFETKGSYTALKEKGKPQVSSTPQYSKDLQVFYEKVMKASGKQLKSVGAPAPSSNFCQMLQEIAEVQRFEVSCFDIPECTTTGQ